MKGRKGSLRRTTITVIDKVTFKWRVFNWVKCVNWYMKCFIYRTADVKSSKLWSSQLRTRFMQLSIQKPEKVRTSTPLKSWLFQASLCNCLKIAFITAMIIAYFKIRSRIYENISYITSALIRLDCDWGSLELKRHICSSSIASAEGTSPILLRTLRESNDGLLSFSSSSLQSSLNQTQSSIAVTPSRSIFSLFIDWTIEGMIISRQNTVASVSRFCSVKMSSIFSRSRKQYTECCLGAWWWS